MALEQKDLEAIESLIYKNADDTAVSISRSFERLEERIDALESRFYAGVARCEGAAEALRRDVTDECARIRLAIEDRIERDAM